MELSHKQILVTGGAGFVGSHLVERLLDEDNEVVVADDFSNGSRESVDSRATVHEVDLTNPQEVAAVVEPNLDGIFHLASHSNPNDTNPKRQFVVNTTMTHELLDAARNAGVTNIAYTSSSTVYGEAPRPTPENYGPLEPISVYGASKLADEGLLSTYAHSYGMTVWNFRFANIVGPRLRGAVIPDFIEKLRADPTRLEILGDGRQEKSYLHVTDCIDAMCHVVEHAAAAAPDRPMHTFNFGTRTTTSVDTIADIVADEMGVEPEFEYTGGNRGWRGDVSRMRLSIERLSKLGGEPSLESTEAVRRATREIIEKI